MRLGPGAVLAGFLLFSFSGGPPARAAERGLPREITGADGASLVLVPKGEFFMGSQPGGYIFGDNELPQRRVYLPDFYIDKYEVTNRRFRKFLAPAETYAGSFDHPDQPVVGVTWFQARDYCARAGRRLPTEAEWEKAARRWPTRSPRGRCARRSRARAVMGLELPSCLRGYSTWEVGSHPAGASPYGAMDMAGNVMEWVADWYAEGYYRVAPLRDPKGPARGATRVLRGGAWFNSEVLLRAAFRTGFNPHLANHGVGFRCARAAAEGVVRRPGGERLARAE